MYSLRNFSLSDMTACAAALRQMGAGASSEVEVAQRITAYLFDHFSDPSKERRECALVRCFMTRPFRELDGPSQLYARQMLGEEPTASEMKCLTLMGTAGLRPEWNQREHSQRYRAIPLASAQFVSQFPMFSQLLAQCGVRFRVAPYGHANLLVNHDNDSFNVFLVTQAKGSPYVPAQEEFVIPYGIQSVLGFGGVLPNHEFFTVILFSKLPITRTTAELFKPLALSIKLALLPFEEERNGRTRITVSKSSAQWQSQVTALDQLLAVHEQAVTYHVHQQQQAEDALRKSEEQYRLLVMQANDSFFRTDSSGRLMFVNPTAMRVMKYGQEELLGRRFSEFIRMDYRLRVERFYFRQFLRRQPNSYHEFPVVAKDGSEIWIGQQVQLLTDGQQVIGFQAVARDITERKLAEELMRRSEAFVTSVIENLPNMVFVKDAQDLRFVRINKAGEELLGYSRAELIGRGNYDFFPNEEAHFFTAKDREVLASGSLLDIPEEPISTRHRGQRILHTKKIPILDESGRPQYLLGISDDITARRLADDQLRDTLNQVRMLTGRLATIQEEERTRIARELHDELGVRLTCHKIDLSNMQQLLIDLPDGEGRQNVAGKIQTMMAQLDDTIASVQQLVSELRPAVLDDLGLVAAIEWQCQDFEKQTKISCTCLAEADELVMAPEQATALFRICQESLTNVARHAQARSVRVSLEAAQGWLRLHVADDGVGISDDKICDRQSFGLLGMKERTARLGGTLSIEGQPGKGTTVTATLPQRNP